MAKFKKALDENTHTAAVDRDLKLGEAVRVNGTPTMFLNGKRVENPTDIAAISAMIEAELKAAPPG
jgi:protein-disulfide isomerase